MFSLLFSNKFSNLQGLRFGWCWLSVTWLTWGSELRERFGWRLILGDMVKWLTCDVWYSRALNGLQLSGVTGVVIQSDLKAERDFNDSKWSRDRDYSIDSVDSDTKMLTKQPLSTEIIVLFLFVEMETPYDRIIRRANPWRTSMIHQPEITILYPGNSRPEKLNESFTDITE